MSGFIQTGKSDKRVTDAIATPSTLENNRLDRCGIRASQLLSFTPKKTNVTTQILHVQYHEYPTNSESMNHVLAADPDVGRRKGSQNR